MAVTKGLFYTNTDNTYSTSPTAIVVYWEKAATQPNDGTCLLNWSSYVLIQATGGSYWRTINTLNTSSGYGSRIQFPNCKSATDVNNTYAATNKIPALKYTTNTYVNIRFNTGYPAQVMTDTTTGTEAAWDASGTKRNCSTLGFENGVEISSEFISMSNNVLKAGTMWKTNSGTVILDAGVNTLKCNIAGWLGFINESISGPADIYLDSEDKVQESGIISPTYTITYDPNGGLLNGSTDPIVETGYTPGADFSVRNTSGLTWNYHTLLEDKTWNTDRNGNGTRFIPGADYTKDPIKIIDSNFSEISKEYNISSSRYYNCPYALRVNGYIQDGKLYYCVYLTCKYESGAGNSGRHSSGSGNITITANDGTVVVSKSLAGSYGKALNGYRCNLISGTTYSTSDAYVYESVVLAGNYTSLSVNCTYTGDNLGNTSAKDNPTPGTATATGTWTPSTQVDTSKNEYNLTDNLILYAVWQHNLTADASYAANTSFTFDGQSKTCIIVATNATITGTNTATDAGTYIAEVTPNEGHAWADGTNNTKQITWEIAAASDSVNIILMSSMPYTGSPQQLISRFSSASDTGQVAVTTTNVIPAEDAWKNNIDEITGTDAGKYYIWYRTLGNNNYNPIVATLAGTVTISRKILSSSDIEVTPYIGLFDGKEHNATIFIKASDWSGDIYSGATQSSLTLVQSGAQANKSYNLLPARKEIGTTTIYYKLSGSEIYGDYELAVTYVEIKFRTVTYDLNRGTQWRGFAAGIVRMDDVDSETYTIDITDSTTELLPVDKNNVYKIPERPNYVFLGFDTDPNATIPEFSYTKIGNKRSVPFNENDINTKLEGSTILYAIWQRGLWYKIEKNGEGHWVQVTDVFFRGDK